MTTDSSDFQMALGWAALGEPIGDDDGSEAAEAMGADVLATPEMQAIKAHIAHVARTCCDTTAESFIRGSDLPRVVQDWVLSDD